MVDCKRYEEFWVEALYGEINDEDRAQLDRHFAECSRCNRRFESLKRTAGLMNRRTRPQLDQAYWNNYYSKLAPKLEQAKLYRGTGVPARERRIPAWFMQVAAAVILLLAGALMGRLFINQPANPPIVKVTPAPEIQNAALTNRTERFLGRSEVLLLGIVNTNSVNLSSSRTVSKDLLTEASALKTELDSPDQTKLRRLVSDLEFILMQISNLEARGDLPEVEIVRSGVDQKALLLKINLEQMKLSEQETDHEKNSKL